MAKEDMFKKSLAIILLLTVALSLQYAISAERASSGRGDDVRPASAPPASTSVSQSELSGVFSYECDDACMIPGAPVPAGKYAVVSPVGKQTVQMIKQAPRLDTLDGKTIAVVGGSFMANITHPEI